MSQKPISELRRRMLEDMAVRNFSEATIRNYIRHIADLAKFLGRSPDTATAEDVRRFQVHMTENGARPPKLNSATSAIRFFFGTTLDRPELARHLARVHYPRPLPRVLSLEEVGRLLEAAPGPGLKYQAALSVAYGAGLRAGEVVMLRISDIDSNRKLIRVEQGKGRKDRYAKLSPRLLELLRAWWSQCRSQGWLFPGRDPLLPVTARQLNRACHMAAKAAGLGTWGLPTYPAALVCHTPAGGQYGCARDPGVVGPFQARDDVTIHTRRHQPPAHRHQPPRPATQTQVRQGGATDLIGLKCWLGLLWRSRRSSATTEPHGVPPTQAM
jgi:integrase/recombinase XerD